MLLNCYTDLVKQVGLLDGRVINQTTSDTEFLAINKRSKATNLNPGVALVRFQFMEILMRLAFKKYDESTHLCSSFSEGSEQQGGCDQAHVREEFATILRTLECVEMEGGTVLERGSRQHLQSSLPHLRQTLQDLRLPLPQTRRQTIHDGRRIRKHIHKCGVSE